MESSAKSKYDALTKLRSIKIDRRRKDSSRSGADVVLALGKGAQNREKEGKTEDELHGGRITEQRNQSFGLCGVEAGRSLFCLT